MGTDIHRLEPGSGFPLGGVRLPCPFRSVADSDGDVLLHALVDALLGACGWGDIGEWFPRSSVEPGQASGDFVAAVLRKMHDAGLSVVNADTVIDLEPVRLADWKPAIRRSIAELIALPPERVNVKAKTAEGLGPVGRGEAVAAQVVVLVAGFDSGAPNGH
jgi:2-C-methyl-D-erythritol 2,4-cyclodiphosphate synthase